MTFWLRSIGSSLLWVSLCGLCHIALQFTKQFNPTKEKKTIFIFLILYYKNSFFLLWGDYLKLKNIKIVFSFCGVKLFGTML